MIEYDAAILQDMADNLYRRAGAILRERMALGVFLGLAIGLLPAAFVDGFLGVGTVIGVLLAIVGAVIGRPSAADRVLRHRFDAQRALCQRQIEKHLRR